MTTLRPARKGDRIRMNMALSLLREVRDILKMVDCPKALEKTRAAVRSTEGATRHLNRRLNR